MFTEPTLPKGGLLGGTGAAPKVSKLQALAAARKKKAEDKNSEGKALDTHEELKRLSLQERRPDAAGGQREAAVPAKRRKVGEPVPTSSGGPQRSPKPQSQVQHLVEPMVLDQLVQGSEASETPIARPSAFAQALFGSASDKPEPSRIERFPLPWLSFAPQCVEDAFSEPSPDDVVSAAQAKGSLSGKARKGH